MRVENIADAPALSRDDGLVSRVLNCRHASEETALTITWVEDFYEA